MLQYVIAGLVFGSLYAIVASGLVVTYLSAGILNFSFGALAFFIARLYYFLHTEHEWGIVVSLLVSVVVVAPLLGVLLYVSVFRLLRLATPLVKIVTTIGVAVAIAPVALIIFGEDPILVAPGIAPRPIRVFNIFDVAVTMDQIIVYIFMVLVMVGGTVVLRYTDVGLRVRAMVDSPALTSLSGTSPDAVAAGVWAASACIAGLVGVVAAPIVGLEIGSYTLLMIAAFAAVIAARLRSLPVAVAVGLAMGVAGSVVQYLLPPSSSFVQAAIPSIPFVATAIFLVYSMFSSESLDEYGRIGGTLDHAIIPQGNTFTPPSTSSPSGAVPSVRLGTPGASRIVLSRWPWFLAALAAVVVPLLLGNFWVIQLAVGIAFGVVFLSFTLVVGEGGMIWLCQVTFAGIGAMGTAQLATVHGWPLGLAVVASAGIAAMLGVLIGLLSIRLGDLYVALVTLTFGLLFDNLVFSREMFAKFGAGVAVRRPDFAGSDLTLAYLFFGVFAIVGLGVVNVRRSTTGLALGAVRGSPTAARMLGVNVVAMKVLVAGLGAFVAALGGAMLAVQNGGAVPLKFLTLLGLGWLAVLVTLGIRSTIAALFAGIAFTMLPEVARVHLSSAWVHLPPLLFGLGAIAVAKFPEGVMVMNLRSLNAKVSSMLSDARTRRTQQGGGALGGKDLPESVPT